jgi:two-component system, chemotaxis family, sensor kinase CheA
MDAMQAIRETFFQECEEQLGELETGLTSMEAGETDTETVNAVFRAVHSIKGGAGAFKLDRLVKFAHGFETTLDKIRNGQLAPSPAVMKVMLKAADVLADLVKDAREGVVNDDARAKELLAELNAFASGGDAPKPVEKRGEEDEEADPFEALGFQPLTFSIGDDELAPAVTTGFIYRIVFKPKPELYYKGNETSRLIRELARLGSIRVKCDTSLSPTLNELDRGRGSPGAASGTRAARRFRAAAASREYGGRQRTGAGGLRKPKIARGAGRGKSRPRRRKA